MLTVADDGPGIPAELLPEVFDRFARGDSSRSRAAGSTGLGLAIVAAVVEAHGGHVDVEQPAGPHRFAVALPAHPPTAGVQEATHASAQAGRRDRRGMTTQRDGPAERAPPSRRRRAGPPAPRPASRTAVPGRRPTVDPAGPGCAARCVTGVLYMWDLAASGWANAFYSAAVQAGSESWTAFFYGSSDAGNSITVDKTPASLWVMAASGAGLRAEQLERSSCRRR